MNKSAKEMFDELGYEEVKNVGDNIMYGHKDKDNYRTIIFWTAWKQISMNFDENDDTLYLKELQAINKQVEELGWNNE